MLSKYPLVGFIPTIDAQRARRFYVDVLKLQFVADDHFALVVRANESTIRIVRLEKFTPAAYTILGWEVSDIATTVGELVQAGVSFLRYPPLQQDDLGIWTAPSGSRVAWFHDPDGNILSVSQH
jgi:catechol 2,3-dioxygenase-like lactoylglutathione lyase family enzyme